MLISTPDKDASPPAGCVPAGGSPGPSQFRGPLLSSTSERNPGALSTSALSLWSPPSEGPGAREGPGSPVWPPAGTIAGALPDLPEASAAVGEGVSGTWSPRVSAPAVPARAEPGSTDSVGADRELSPWWGRGLGEARAPANRRAGRPGRGRSAGAGRARGAEARGWARGVEQARVSVRAPRDP